MKNMYVYGGKKLRAYTLYNYLTNDKNNQVLVQAKDRAQSIEVNQRDKLVFITIKSPASIVLQK